MTMRAYQKTGFARNGRIGIRKAKLTESRKLIEGFLADKDQLYQVAVVGSEVVALLHASRHAEVRSCT